MSELSDAEADALAVLRKKRIASSALTLEAFAVFLKTVADSGREDLIEDVSDRVHVLTDTMKADGWFEEGWLEK